MRCRACAAAGSGPKPCWRQRSDASRDLVVWSRLPSWRATSSSPSPCRRAAGANPGRRAAGLAPVVGPAVVRIGPDRTLLDPPWEMVGCAVAHVWPDDRLAGGWARVEWPVDVWSHRPIAPLDLHLGHVLAT